MAGEWSICAKCTGDNLPSCNNGFETARLGVFATASSPRLWQYLICNCGIRAQVTQALLALGIEPIFALSPQAKGRVQRLFNTLQDRLVQELRLAGITNPEQATVFVNGPFKADFNTRFAKPARESQAVWRPLPKGLDVDRICSFRYEATVMAAGASITKTACSWRPPRPRFNCR